MDLDQMTDEQISAALEKVGLNLNLPILRCVDKLLGRAQRAEAEVRKLTKDLQELLAERRDLKAMLADAGIRNAVLEKRVDKLLCELEQDGEPLACPLARGWKCPQRDRKLTCSECWREWLEQEVRP